MKDVTVNINGRNRAAECLISNTLAPILTSIKIKNNIKTIIVGKVVYSLKLIIRIKPLRRSLIENKNISMQTPLMAQYAKIKKAL